MSTTSNPRPTVALTLGDIAGIGPEVVARVWGHQHLHELARPIVVGDAATLRRALGLVGGGPRVRVETIRDPESALPTPDLIPCLEVDGIDAAALRGVEAGTIDARAGRAAARWLEFAIDLALAGRVDAITTLPLHKESLRLAGVEHPGHTEILAERCGAADHAMMLYLAPEANGMGPGGRSCGLGVVHVTLHLPLRSVFDLLTTERVLGKIRLADRAIRPLLGGRCPRVAVAGLNPHAGENGLFGREEIEVIAPAVARAGAEGIDVAGPIAADTLFGRAMAGEFDVVVAMYHDQGHVALKTTSFHGVVNVTLGLPIVRTSVAHGTAFDIAWRGQAIETTSLLAALATAARLVAARPRRPA